MAETKVVEEKVRNKQVLAKDYITANGALMAKPVKEAYSLLETMAANNFQWHSDRSASAKLVESQNNEALVTLTATIVNLATKIEGLSVQKPAHAVNAIMPRCEYCGEGHIIEQPFLATSNTLIDVGKGELTMRIQDAQVTFNMLNLIKSPKENEKSLKIEAAKEGVSKTAIDGDLNNRQIDPGENSQKYLTEIDSADQFRGHTMLKAPPWCNKSKSPHHINQELPFTPGVQKNITSRDTRNWNSCKDTSTPYALIDPG
ncbi:uncharacterized protein G2W53_035068 [Senna tora]|uniref:Uncharacterized protein n=1 Tax=Senna tora TaxID=362788 RepID=A0A834W3S6_9FABA|nr:uncharacterized protein G2W53_035068 [Senna tora]